LVVGLGGRREPCPGHGPARLRWPKLTKRELESCTNTGQGDHRSLFSSRPQPVPFWGFWDGRLLESFKKSLREKDFCGERGGTRTLDPMIKSQMIALRKTEVRAVLTSRLARSYDPSGRFQNRGGAGLTRSHLVEARPRSTFRFQDNQRRNSARKPCVACGSGCGGTWRVVRTGD
jgi:hypothetical protein